MGMTDMLDVLEVLAVEAHNRMVIEKQRAQEKR